MVANFNLSFYTLWAISMASSGASGVCKTNRVVLLVGYKEKRQ